MYVCVYGYVRGFSHGIASVRDIREDPEHGEDEEDEEDDRAEGRAGPSGARGEVIKEHENSLLFDRHTLAEEGSW